MEKNGSKIVVVVALVIAVVALAVGFAAYTATLQITTATAIAPATDTFQTNVKFTGTPVCHKDSDDSVVTSAGTIGGTNVQTWSGVAVTLAGVGDSITCTATITNSSTFTAYLDSITPSSGVECVTYTGNSNGATQNIQDACDTVTVTVKVNNADTTAITRTSYSATTGITGNSIAAGGNTTVTMQIAYAGPAVPDGDFQINVPSITLGYSTVE